MRANIQWRWHLNEVFVRINGATCYLWRAADHEGEVLEAFVTKKRDRKAALKFLRKAMKRYGRPEVIATDGFRSYRAAMRDIGNQARQEACGMRSSKFQAALSYALALSLASSSAGSRSPIRPPPTGKQGGQAGDAPLAGNGQPGHSEQAGRCINGALCQVMA